MRTLAMVDDDTLNLFDDSVFQPRKRPGANELVIRASRGQVLSKEQRTFNRLTKRIAELERRMSAERERLELLVGRYLEKVAPVEQELAKQQLELARSLAAASERFALRKRQKEDLRELLLDVFDQAFVVSKPDAATEALYDKWADTSYGEELRQEAEELKRRMADALKNEYGIEVDVSDDDHSPEAIARFLHEVQQKARTAEAEKPRSRGHRRRPKQESREAELQQREILTKKSVRDVYLSLAKVLHPDTVSDAAERSLREDYMKQATFAYRQGDLAALLKLELRWVIRTDAGPEALRDDTLRVYIPALQEQLARLERAIAEQMHDPRYAPIGPVAAMKERTALDRLNDRAQALRAYSKATEQQAAFVRGCTSKTDFTIFVRDYLRSLEAEWDFDERMPDDDWG